MDYQSAQNFWIEHDRKAVKMPTEELRYQIEQFSYAHNTMALATGAGDYIRCTPVEYTYYQSCYWIMSEGGRKFIGLEKNKNVSFAIFEPYSGFSSVHGLQVNGTAQLIEPFSQTYLAFLAYKKIPEEAVRKMKEPMPMIRITPVEADFLDSSFRKEGYDSRQHLDY